MTEITTAEELDALPVGSVVLVLDQEWHRTRDGRWLCEDGDVLRTGGLHHYATDADGPGLTLYHPDAPAPAAEDREGEHLARDLWDAEVDACLSDIEDAGHTVEVNEGGTPDECADECPACAATRLRGLFAARQPAPTCDPCDHAESMHGRCTRCGMTWEQQAVARQPAPSFTPAQRHAAEQDPALFRIATRAQFGTGEVVDIVLRALGVPVVAPVVSAEQVERAASRAAEHFEEEDAEGPIDCRCGGHCGPESIETHRLHVALAALGIEVQDRG